LLARNHLKIWNFSGECLYNKDTNQMKNFTVSLSPNGRFFALGTWTSEVKVNEIHLKKDRTFDKVSHAMTLTGHKKSVPTVTFTSDSSRMLTSSADGSLKLWNIAVRYEVREEPKEIWAALHTPPLTLLSVSPNDKVFVAVVDRTLLFFNLQKGDTPIYKLTTSHQSSILECTWSADGTLMGTVAAGEKLVRLWKLSAMWEKALK